MCADTCSREGEGSNMSAQMLKLSIRYSRRQKNTPFPFRFRSVPFTGNERACFFPFPFNSGVSRTVCVVC